MRNVKYTTKYIVSFNSKQYLHYFSCKPYIIFLITQYSTCTKYMRSYFSSNYQLDKCSPRKIINQINKPKAEID